MCPSFYHQLKILQAGWLRDGTWPEGMLVPMSDDLPSAQTVADATIPIGVSPSERDLRRGYYDPETPSTIMEPSPLRSPCIAVGEGAGELTVVDDMVENAVAAAGIDVDVERGDGRHEGG